MLKYSAVIEREGADVDGKPTKSIYFPGLVERATVYPDDHANHHDMMIWALKDAINFIIECGDHVPQHTPKEGEEAYELDWQTELRVLVSNWFVKSGMRGFEKIAQAAGLVDGTCDANYFTDLFNVHKEMDFCDFTYMVSLLRAYKIPVNVKDFKISLA